MATDKENSYQHDKPVRCRHGLHEYEIHPVYEYRSVKSDGEWTRQWQCKLCGWFSETVRGGTYEELQRPIWEALGDDSGQV